MGTTVKDASLSPKLVILFLGIKKELRRFQAKEKIWFGAQKHDVILLALWAGV